MVLWHQQLNNKQQIRQTPPKQHGGYRPPVEKPYRKNFGNLVFVRVVIEHILFGTRVTFLQLDLVVIYSVCNGVHYYVRVRCYCLFKQKTCFIANNNYPCRQNIPLPGSFHLSKGYLNPYQINIPYTFERYAILFYRIKFTLHS